MADEQPKTRKKGGAGRVVMIAAGALLLGAVAAGGGFYAATKATAGGHAETAEEEEQVQRETTYFEIEKGFTSNLKEPDRYVEIALGVSSYDDPLVGDMVKKHEVALRSAVLGLLAEQSIGSISSLQGKTRLQGRLKEAMNATLKAKEGKAPIADVYYTSFVIQ